jgi:APA family basic amino acid/polyamine antiporter
MTEPAAASDAPHFKKGISLIDLVTLGAGTAIGSSVFTVMGPAAKVAGSGMVISLLIAALPMVILRRRLRLHGLGRAEDRGDLRMAAGLHLAGGGLRRGLDAHPVERRGHDDLRPDPGEIRLDGGRPAGQATMFVLFAIIFGLNYFGVAVAARAQTILMFGLLAVFALLVALAAPSIKPQIFVDAVSGGWTPILAALPLMISLFLGIEAATEVGDEVKDPSRNVPLGLILAMILTAVVYLAICLASLGLIGPKALADSDAPLVAAGQVVLGGLAKPLIVTAAVLALLKSMNAVFLVYSRFLYAMGKAGQLPTALGKVHPRWGTPHVATFVAFLLSCSGLLLPSSLLFLLLAVSVPTMAKYFGSCLAAYSVARNHPEVHDKARIKLSRPTVKTLAVVGMIAAVVIASLGVGTDIRPYYLLGGWLVLGLAYYYGWVRRRGHA